MLLADADPVSKVLPYANLGAFGLLVAGAIWFFRYGVPMFFKRQRHLVARVVKVFGTQAKENREERMQLAAQAAAERTLDRELWRMLNATLQELIAEYRKQNESRTQ